MSLEPSLQVLHKSNRSFQQKFRDMLLQAALHIILCRGRKGYKAALPTMKEKKAIVESKAKTKEKSYS